MPRVTVELTKTAGRALPVSVAGQAAERESAGPFQPEGLELTVVAEREPVPDDWLEEADR